jgi:hypothetical protein
LRSYNPTVNGGCTNLIAGDTICLSAPAGLSKLKTAPRGQA